MIGNGSQTLALNNSKLQLELYLEMIQAEAEEFTLDSLRSLAKNYGIISKFSDKYFSVTSQEIDLSVVTIGRESLCIRL
jgi:hypothetical protein